MRFEARLRLPPSATRPCAPEPEGAESTDGHGRRGRERCADRPESGLLTALLDVWLLTWRFSMPARCRHLFTARAGLGFSGAKGVGDALVGDISLPVNGRRSSAGPRRRARRGGRPRWRALPASAAPRRGPARPRLSPSAPMASTAAAACAHSPCAGHPHSLANRRGESAQPRDHGVCPAQGPSPGCEAFEVLDRVLQPVDGHDGPAEPRS